MPKTFASSRQAGDTRFALAEQRPFPRTLPVVAEGRLWARLGTAAGKSEASNEAS